MKGMEVGRKLRVCLTEVRMNLVDTRRWTRRDQRAGEWSINLSGEKRRITDIFLAQRYNLAFPSMFHGSHANVVCILNWSYTPACSESACCSVPSSCKKAESTACLTKHRQERSILRSSNNWHIWWNMHRRVMGRGEEGSATTVVANTDARRQKRLFNFARKPPGNIPEVSPKTQNALY